ncbi:hypothetical protein GYMLUDRAFT_83464 [Collybiopsis luxurians FD-317 M1]|uniref:BHLH domain-containing protein n=1 Tax=Collybiopsis luxurians FD-317 M1 TaxID=944289 RepID=A0A0D0BIZ4_9AGAR|nr:hypothetical protein GYMLUDRAFT_83464 [Collybiopsis luxurians FD-317 M1]
MNHNMNSTSPNSGAPSPLSDDSSIQPQSPVSPHQDSFENNNSNSKVTGKRKPSRRASTAERRATHNAVERARRETLNGRFLDLAALLPNLSQLRRPSKSAIVNSSIAHIHAARRHRLLASRELRLLKLETVTGDALRRELNEWRNRSGIPRIEEPVRGEGFSVVLSGEPEIIPIPGGAGIQEEDEDGFGEEIDDDYRPMNANPMQNDEVAAAMFKSQAQPPFVPAINTNVHPIMRPSMHPRAHTMGPAASGPMIASPTTMSFENPILGRAFDSIPYGASEAYPGSFGPAPEKWGGYPGNVNDQAYLKSLAQSRRSRSSSQSSGSASPPSAYYDQVGWNNGNGNGWNGNTMMNGGNVNGMNMDMGIHAGSMGMVGGGGSTLGNGGATFAMMM